MIKPTIGRIVWYTPHVHEPDPDRGEQKLAAIVVHVHDDHHINIAGWTSRRHAVPQADVLLGPTGGRDGPDKRLR